LIDFVLRGGAEHGEHVTQMNENRGPASGRVQRAAVRVTGVIDEPGHPTATS
jgi:hypothetical protein